MKQTFSSTKIIAFLLLGLILFSCESKTKDNEEALTDLSWEKIEQKAKGKTVNFMMWQGGPELNNYINNYVVPTLKKKYDINLEITGGQGPEIVQLVMGQKEAGIEEGQVDMAWINGETSFQLRKIDGLWGPFISELPNIEYVDLKDPYINTDFQQPIAGMECPWGISQFGMVYDSAKVENPPQTLDELEAYVKKYPGTFTISNDFTGMTVMKSFLAELGGSPNSLDGKFDEEKYDRLSKKLWDFINSNKEYFWKEGETFPKEQTKVAQLMANGEIYVSYGFSEGGIEETVISGLFPKSTRAYAWKNGTIKNSNYLGILDNAPEKAAAMVVINFLISPEAQFKKSHPDGADLNTILTVDRLPEKWQKKFNNAPKRKYGLEMEDLAENAIQEPAPEYMLRLYEDFRKKVIEK